MLKSISSRAGRHLLRRQRTPASWSYKNNNKYFSIVSNANTSLCQKTLTAPSSLFMTSNSHTTAFSTTSYNNNSDVTMTNESTEESSFSTINSNVGRRPIALPEGVSVDIDESTHKIKITGPTGSQELDYFENLNVFVEGEDTKSLHVQVNEDAVIRSKGRSSGVGVLERRRRGPKNTKVMWGTTRALLANMVRGVSLGYRVELNLVGVGYRAAFSEAENVLTLKLGLSHDVLYPIPEGIRCRVPKPTIIRLSGSNKQAMMQSAAEIRAFRKPEPYKGKGIRYKDEVVVLKAKKKK